MNSSNNASLHEHHCDACRSDAAPITEFEAKELMTSIPLWGISNVTGVDQLVRTYTFKNFVEALKFTNRVGDIAEKENHHPEIRTEWGKVTVLWWTHKISGLHKNDFVMAAQTDQLFEN